MAQLVANDSVELFLTTFGLTLPCYRGLPSVASSPRENCKQWSRKHIILQAFSRETSKLRGSFRKGRLEGGWMSELSAVCFLSLGHFIASERRAAVEKGVSHPINPIKIPVRLKFYSNDV